MNVYQLRARELVLWKPVWHFVCKNLHLPILKTKPQVPWFDIKQFNRASNSKGPSKIFSIQSKAFNENHEKIIGIKGKLNENEKTSKIRMRQHQVYGVDVV